MANEQVRIDLTANDQASKKIDAVADDVAALEKLDPEIEISADDKASKAIADVADDAAELERRGAELHLTADDDASRVIADVADEAAELSRRDQEIVLKARIDDARAGLKSLRDDLEQTEDKAQNTARQLDKVGDSGPGLRGNAIADLTGPLGDASSAASDFAGVFDGLGDISESVAEKVGISAGTMSTAIGGIGVAVAAAAALWTYYRQKQEEARRKQEELVKGQRELNKAIAEGDRVAAAKSLEELYGGALDAAEQLGLGISQTTRYITGQTDALPGLTDEIDRLTAEMERHGGETNAANAQLAAQRERYRELAGAISGARGDYEQANGTIAEQDRRLRQIGGALDTATRATSGMARAQDDAAGSVDGTNAALDRLRGGLDFEQAMLDFQRVFADAANNNEQTIAEQQQDVLDYKKFIVDTGAELKKSPLEIQTVLEQVDQGDLYGTKATIDQWFKMNPVIIASKLDRPVPGGGSYGTIAPQSVLQDVPSIGVLNMALPAGWRGDPIRLAHTQRRRSGRFFARSG